MHNRCATLQPRLDGGRLHQVPGVVRGEAARGRVPRRRGGPAAGRRAVAEARADRHRHRGRRLLRRPAGARVPRQGRARPLTSPALKRGLIC